MADNMSEVEENYAEVRRVTRRNMANMEEEPADMAHDMSRKTSCMKAEIKKVKGGVIQVS